MLKKLFVYVICGLCTISATQAQEPLEEYWEPVAPFNLLEEMWMDPLNDWEGLLLEVPELMDEEDQQPVAARSFLVQEQQEIIVQEGLVDPFTLIDIVTCAVAEQTLADKKALLTTINQCLMTVQAKLGNLNARIANAEYGIRTMKLHIIRLGVFSAENRAEAARLRLKILESEQLIRDLKEEVAFEMGKIAIFAELKRLTEERIAAIEFYLWAMCNVLPIVLPSPPVLLPVPDPAFLPPVQPPMAP